MATFFPFALERWDVVITASEFSRVYGSAFGIRPAKVKVTGYPRNDVLNSDPPSISFIEDLKRLIMLKCDLCSNTQTEAGTPLI